MAGSNVGDLIDPLAGLPVQPVADFDVGVERGDGQPGVAGQAR